jgi:site-specific DNA-cytosine methylase
VWEVLRIAQDIGVSMIFMENVDNLRFMTDFSHAWTGELAKLDFQIAWISLSAHHVGSPQRRRRVFLLAKRGSALAAPFGPALPRWPSGVFADARLPFLQKNKGLRFNGGGHPRVSG